MPSLADVLKQGPQSLTGGRFEVAQVSPLLVYLDGGTAATEGSAVDGCTYTLGATGLYFHIQGQWPLCFQTV
jgi:hypothetical protein